MKDIVILDLFSGIGGFSKGLSNAGFNIKTHYFSEIDKHAIAVYKYKFKDSIYAGSVTDLDGRTITRPNIITFGSPCQDFSVAGKRAGMEGQRSSLIGQALRLIAECRPNVFIWENVKGVFSSNSGADFWAIIQAFAYIGGYRLEWQLLNTSWFLPQNRERIYLIGRLARPERNWQAVFPIGGSIGSDYGNEKPNETTSVRTLSGGGHSGGNHSSMTLIKANLNSGISNNEGGVAPTLQSRDYKGYSNQDMDFVLIEPTHKHGDGSLSRDYSEQDRVYDADESKEAATVAATSNSKYLNRGQIRRLTEVECERLQGFEDDWTAYGDYDGVIKKVAKSQRYKMLGNAVTVRVVEEIGKRLLKVESF